MYVGGGGAGRCKVSTLYFHTQPCGGWRGSDVPADGFLACVSAPVAPAVLSVQPSAACLARLGTGGALRGRVRNPLLPPIHVTPGQGGGGGGHPQRGAALLAGAGAGTGQGKGSGMGSGMGSGSVSRPAQGALPAVGAQPPRLGVLGRYGRGSPGWEAGPYPLSPPPHTTPPTPSPNLPRMWCALFHRSHSACCVLRAWVVVWQVPEPAVHTVGGPAAWGAGQTGGLRPHAHAHRGPRRPFTNRVRARSSPRGPCACPSPSPSPSTRSSTRCTFSPSGPRGAFGGRGGSLGRGLPGRGRPRVRGRR